jgi:hypothetical protein
MVDPIKVEVIVQFPPPCTVPQLQRLQCKENFLQCFIANYVEITKEFMCLLEKGVPLFWDEAAQHSRSFEMCPYVYPSAPASQL